MVPHPLKLFREVAECTCFGLEATYGERLVISTGPLQEHPTVYTCRLTCGQIFTKVDCNEDFSCVGIQACNT